MSRAWIKSSHINFSWEFDPGSGLTLAACITHASRTMKLRWFLRNDLKWISGERVSNAWVTRLTQGDSLWKRRIIPYDITISHEEVIKVFSGVRWTCVWLASWWDNSSPRQRSVAGLRECTATLGLRHGPDSYGRQQWGILHNGGNPDAATPRDLEGLRVVKIFCIGRKWQYYTNKVRLITCQQPR